MSLSVKIGKGSAYKAAARKRRAIRVRKRVSGTPVRPRLVVSRSNRHMVAQVIDDLAGHTLASASTLDVSIKGVDGDKTERVDLKPVDAGFVSVGEPVHGVEHGVMLDGRRQHPVAPCVG